MNACLSPSLSPYVCIYIYIYIYMFVHICIAIVVAVAVAIAIAVAVASATAKNKVTLASELDSEANNGFSLSMWSQYAHSNTHVGSVFIPRLDQ